MTETPAMKRMMRQRSALIYSHAFFGVLSLNLLLVETTKIETLATNGKELLFNSTCVMRMDDDELLFGIAHEVLHCALFHPMRRGVRDPHLWNIACDYVVNAHLKRAGFKLPSWVYYDPQYDGLSAEEVYRLLSQQSKDESKAQDTADQAGEQEQSQEQEQQDGSASAQADSGQDDGDGPSDEVDQDAGSDGGDQGDDGGQQGADAGGEADGSSDHGDSSSSSEDGAGGSLDNPTGDEQQAGGQPGAQDDVGGGRLPLNEDGKLEDQVLDAAPDNPGKEAEIQADWDQMTRQAVNVSRAQGAGYIPGWLKSIADDSAKSVVDWREAMRRFLSQSDTKRQTWSRPSRRLSGVGVYMPGSISDGVNHIVWVADSSGSMSDRALSACKAELQAALDEGVVDKLTVISCDARVHNTAEFARGDVIEFEFQGRGGTRFSPAFEWIEENAPDAAGIVYFSDLEAYDYGVEPRCQVLWAAYGDPRTLPQWIAKLPFGEAITITWDD